MNSLCHRKSNLCFRTIIIQCAYSIDITKDYLFIEIQLYDVNIGSIFVSAINYADFDKNDFGFFFQSK